jgi:Fur family transcriptional regulator, ferric uptake regulator
MRMTSRQQAVRGALLARTKFISAQDLHVQLRAAGHRVGLTTVYRTLRALEASGEVHVLRTPDGIRVYRACGRDSHHHLICRACGRAAEVPSSTLERWAARVAGGHGFTEVSLVAEFFATCPACAAPAPGRAASRAGRAFAGAQRDGGGEQEGAVARRRASGLRSALGQHAGRDAPRALPAVGADAHDVQPVAVCLEFLGVGELADGPG